MRTGAVRSSIGVMKRPIWKRHWKKRRSRYLTTGMEVSGALSAATQMALLCPPGFEEWVRHELVGDGSLSQHRMGPSRGERRH